MTDYAKARKRAFWLLSRWQYHSCVLREKLKQKGFSSESVEKVIDDCKRFGFLNDKEAILSQLRRGFGPRYIQYKFQISSNEVRDVITRDLQKERILDMRPKLGEKEKAIRTLLRKGFDFDIVIEIFSYQGVE